MSLRKLSLLAVAPALVALLAGLTLGSPSLWQPAALAAAVLLAFGSGASSALKPYQFTAWVIASLVAALLYPQQLIHGTGIDLTNKWIRLIAIQTVMFGMGTQMGLKDFAGVLKMPWGVFVAVFSQFTVMPLVGWGLTKLFAFPDEIAAGVILIGCCSSGLASNVMCYIAKCNLALSITATAVTTMLAPLMTPTWMSILAGEKIPVSFINMMAEIVKIVLVPIGAGLLHDYLKHGSPIGRRNVHALAFSSAIVVTALIVFWPQLSAPLSANGALFLELFGFALGAIIAGVAYHHLSARISRLDSWMPIAAMVGILYFTGLTTAVGRDNLIKVGGILFLVAALHNALGYLLGYWLARAGRLDEASCRTVAIEVGLQNGGMASGIAGGMGKLATVGLAAAVFGSWMNISGSILANFWRRRPTP